MRTTLPNRRRDTGNSDSNQYASAVNILQLFGNRSIWTILLPPEKPEKCILSLVLVQNRGFDVFRDRSDLSICQLAVSPKKVPNLNHNLWREGSLLVGEQKHVFFCKIRASAVTAVRNAKKCKTQKELGKTSIVKKRFHSGIARIT